MHAVVHINHRQRQKYTVVWYRTGAVGREYRLQQQQQQQQQQDKEEQGQNKRHSDERGHPSQQNAMNTVPGTVVSPF
jgi:hypothetical protein